MYNYQIYIPVLPENPRAAGTALSPAALSASPRVPGTGTALQWGGWQRICPSPGCAGSKLPGLLQAPPSLWAPSATEGDPSVPSLCCPTVSWALPALRGRCHPQAEGMDPQPSLVAHPSLSCLGEVGGVSPTRPWRRGQPGRGTRGSRPLASCQGHRQSHRPWWSPGSSSRGCRRPG